MSGDGDGDGKLTQGRIRNDEITDYREGAGVVWTVCVRKSLTEGHELIDGFVVFGGAL
jgi:hypothetical protein